MKLPGHVAEHIQTPHHFYVNLSILAINVALGFLF